MLLITARKAFPSLQLGPKSFTCTPSCLLTCFLILRILLFKPLLGHNLGLDPLEQSLFGSNLPALLSFPADASLPNRTVVIRARTIIMMTTMMVILMMKMMITIWKTKMLTILILTCWHSQAQLIRAARASQALSCSPRSAGKIALKN